MNRTGHQKAAAWFAVAFLAATTLASAQTPVTVSLDSVLYGDNTEFFSPFRTGETILGSWQRVTTDIEMSDKATLKMGAYANERDGADRRAELARPAVSLTLGTARHRFLIGTLETGNRPSCFGPDRTTPHGLLPPLAVETLWFTRAYETGVQWKENTERFTQDMWIDYRRLVTPEHRELFDGGVVGRVQRSETAPVALVYQWQVVHHGGQQFNTGPVSDSFAYGPGVLLRRRLPRAGASTLEVYSLFSYDRPDRERDDLTVQGKAILIRGAVEKQDWRGHLLLWKGRTFKHEEGDPNYLSAYPDGSDYPGARDYAEVGLARLFRPAPNVEFEASGRAHLVQGQWGYSYRLVGTVHLAIWHASIK